LVTKTHGYKKRERKRGGYKNRDREMVTKRGIKRDGYKKRDRERWLQKESYKKSGIESGYKTKERDGYKIRCFLPMLQS
jgi:hypothetical protein